MNMNTNRNFKTYVLISFLGCISLIVLQKCTIDQKTSAYQNILNFTDSIKVINTHEHQHHPEEYGVERVSFYHLVHGAYLMQDIISAGGKRLDMEPLDTLSLEEQWEMFGELLNFTNQTSYYGHFVKGIQKLYDFDDLYFTEKNIPPLSAQITKNYSN